MAVLTDPLASAVAELEEDKVRVLVPELVAAGTPPLGIVGRLQEGMNEVGLRFETGDYYLSELIMAGEIMKEAMACLEPVLAGSTREYRGTVVIGTVKGDIHDLGKNIVVMLLKGAGYNVIDLGVDVPGDNFVAAIREYGAPLVGMSVLLTACQEGMKNTIDQVRASGLPVTILIGGNYVNDLVKDYVGADYFGTTAVDAVKVADLVFTSQQ
ncbi:MAG TPA: cobalamin-dependent protein [Spirochaetia bacterium]|nr:cobalamin-dependent protein [Spirochaetia bacterium]